MGSYAPAEVWQWVLFIVGASVLLGCFIAAMADETEGRAGLEYGERLLFTGGLLFVLSAAPLFASIGLGIRL